MKIDIALEPAFSPGEIAELGLLAERHGIHTLWITHDPEARDPFLCLSELARASTTIRCGIFPISPFEMHPLKMAVSLLTLNELAAGRASLVVGAGGAFLGTGRFSPKRRVRAVRECIDILKNASADRVTDYPGELYRASRFQPGWATQTPPQVLAGANKPQMLRMATLVADGIVMSDLLPSMVAEACKTVAGGLHANGRSRDGYELNNYWAWHVKPDLKKAVAEARSRLAMRGMLKRPWISRFLSESDCDLVESGMAAFYRAFKAKSPDISGVPDAIVAALVENLTLTSDTAGLDDRLEKLRDFESAGLTHITLGLHDDPAESIRIIGERVVPALAQDSRGIG